jgi:hypothetical protein
MSDEQAKLYIRVEGKIYRFKVFESTVGVEHQPGGPNILYPRDPELYHDETSTWDMNAILHYIDVYEHGEPDV